MDTEIVEREGFYVGPWRRPRNDALAVGGSIHADAMAQRLGFRGGLVAGSVHAELFPPLLLRAFGRRWFERGNLSLYFLDPTLDQEEVRAMVAVPPPGATNAQVTVWAERPDGRRTGEGTAAVGEPTEPSALAARKLDRYEPGELRILADISPGDQFPEVEVIVTQEDMDRRLAVTTDPLLWYRGDSPWGGAVTTPHNLVGAMMQPCSAYQRTRQGEAVGLFGAFELRHVNGPVLVGRPYRAGGYVLTTGQSPKTEYFWFEAYMDDEQGLRTAEMRMMLRFMKASSSAYQESAAG